MLQRSERGQGNGIRKAKVKLSRYDRMKLKRFKVAVLCPLDCRECCLGEREGVCQ